MNPMMIIAWQEQAKTYRQIAAESNSASRLKLLRKQIKSLKDDIVDTVGYVYDKSLSTIFDLLRLADYQAGYKLFYGGMDE